MKWMNVYRAVRAYSSLLVVLALAGSINACKQEFSKTIPDTDYSDEVNVTYGAPKVLYVIVDGVRGKSVQTIEPPTMKSLLASSIYSWTALSDEHTTKPGANWASLMTGVSTAKHGVVNNNFDESHFETYPLIYKRIKDADPEMDIRVFTSSALFKDHLTAGSDHSELLTDDDAVKSATVTALGDAEADFVVAHFQHPNTVGAQAGYDASITSYKEAILKFDADLDALMGAIKARPSYSEENWLIVVTSSIGGDYPVPPNENDNTVFSEPLVNTFTIFSALKYNTRFIGKPFIGNKFQGDFPRFEGQRRAVLEDGDNSVYNLGDGEFTIEMKIKKNKRIQGIYPCLLGKRPEWSSGWASNGWVMFLEDDYWQFNARGTTGAEQVRGGQIADASWSSVAAVGVVRDGKRYVRTFTNGAFYQETEITGWGNLDTDAPLTMGYIPGTGHGEPDAYVADVRIWKKAIPDDLIAKYACEIGVDENHPYFDYLAGYWPGTNSEDGLIRDEGPFGNHLKLQSDDFTYDRLNEYLCAPSTENLGELVPRTFDIPAQIFTWLRIPRQEAWQLDGRVWLDQ